MYGSASTSTPAFSTGESVMVAVSCAADFRSTSSADSTRLQVARHRVGRVLAQRRAAGLLNLDVDVGAVAVAAGSLRERAGAGAVGLALVDAFVGDRLEVVALRHR